MRDERRAFARCATTRLNLRLGQACHRLGMDSRARCDSIEIASAAVADGDSAQWRPRRLQATLAMSVDQGTTLFISSPDVARASVSRYDLRASGRACVAACKRTQPQSVRQGPIANRNAVRPACEAAAALSCGRCWPPALSSSPALAVFEDRRSPG